MPTDKEVRDVSWKGGNPAGNAAEKAVFDAQFGRGSHAGNTGNTFIDDPFFNPWAPGGSFNTGRSSRHASRRARKAR